MPCGGCSKPIPPDARFCPNCGIPAGAGAASRPALTMDEFRDLEKTGERSSSAKCPRCAIAMTESLYGELAVEECFSCGGMWFDERELQGFVARYRARKEAVEGVPLDSRLQRFSPAGPVVYLPCPRCGRLMSRFNFGRISGVIVDKCVDGMWLDAGEVEKIVAFIQTGGLVEGERRRVEQLKDQARRAEMQADVARSTAARYRGAGPPFLGPMIFWDIW